MWQKANPRNITMAQWLPYFFVVLETTGRRTGEARQVPVARGPIEGDVAWLISVHGSHANYAHNIADDPRVRLRVGRNWRAGSARLEPMDPKILAMFSPFAKFGMRMTEHDPQLVRIDLDPR
ncbi:hypothetical protein VV02_02180 [Luteipulveratus mongoliensis]|uniref:Nitroreductase n=2 Tax=Luteipulveratus mongoliensis TaxID=571913 RepID=A0A0K1JE08_9MICO|nr:hypothetical protein VV02_02180 [Luteipulveratus mongoliensis]